MLTDQDIQKLSAVFATKDDFKPFATKDDLKSFATRDDLKAFATKDDLSMLKTSIELQFGKVHEEIGSLREIIQEVAVSADKFVHQIADQESEHAAINGQLSRHEEWFKTLADKQGIALKYD